MKKVGDVGIDRHSLCLQTHHGCSARADPRPGDQFVDGRRRTLRQDLHGAISQIANPSDQIEPPRRLTARLTVGDALHEARDNQPNRLHLGG